MKAVRSTEQADNNADKMKRTAIETVVSRHIEGRSGPVFITKSLKETAAKVQCVCLWAFFVWQIWSFCGWRWFYGQAEKKGSSVSFFLPLPLFCWPFGIQDTPARNGKRSASIHGLSEAVFFVVWFHTPTSLPSRMHAPKVFAKIKFWWRWCGLKRC